MMRTKPVSVEENEDLPGNAKQCTKQCEASRFAGESALLG
jgi:hypothetical protein